MAGKKFTLGIDLGTSNCALSVCDLGTDDLRMIDIVQTTAPNQTAGQETLPSAVYLAHESEFPEGSTGCLGGNLSRRGSLVALLVSMVRRCRTGWC